MFMLGHGYDPIQSQHKLPILDYTYTITRENGEPRTWVDPYSEHVFRIPDAIDMYTLPAAQYQNVQYEFSNTSDVTKFVHLHQESSVRSVGDNAGHQIQYVV
jgi:hypothetical protein